MKGDRMAKRSSFGSKVRKRLSDITNVQSSPKITSHEEKPLEVSPATDDFINQLIKEKMTLMKLIEERNKIIELSGNELQNLRMNFQKLQLQNWNLAQSNSQILAELNFGKERVKALQHELLSKEALLKSKNKEEEEGEEVDGESQCHNVSKPCNRYRRRSTISKCYVHAAMGHSTKDQQVTEKEKLENKRRYLRRRSSRFKSQEQAAAKNLFEIEGTHLPITFDYVMCETDSSSTDSSISNEETCGARIIELATQRSSIGRPLRRATAKVQSYKEIPINIKMRRSE